MVETDSKMTINDVAEALGISKTTVSRAISGKGRISQKTREMVMQYIGEHNYSPNVMAKGLATSRTYNIGFVIPGDYQISDSPFFQKCMFAISEVASERDYDMIVSSIRGDDIGHLERLVSNHKVDGIILGRTVENDPSIRYLMAQHLPFVTIGTTQIPGVVQIDNDHFSACVELTSLLLLKGFTKLGLIGGNRDYIVNQSRYNGFVAAHEKLGKSVKRSCIYMDVINMAGTDRAVDDLLEQGVQCIVCMDDFICHYVLNKLSRDNLLVPQDIKVASFYDSYLMDTGNPAGTAITSIRFDTREMGTIACRSLMELIEGKEVPAKNYLGYNIVLKSSTQSV